MELAFDDRQLLLPGVHEVSMETVKEHFGKFQRSDRRMKLFAKLTEYLDAVKKAGCGVSVVIDGSFVMACIDVPDDIDVILVLPIGWDDTEDIKPFQYNLVSKKSVRKTHGFDVFVVKPGSAREAELINFFSGVNVKWREKFGWPDNTRKGILRVMI
jgi:hypothetical protein